VRGRGTSRFKTSRLLRLAGESILMVGCGSGRYLRLCASCGRKALGADILADRAAEAAAFSGAGTVVADAAALPFREKSFDTVTLLDVIEHVPDDAAALAEAVRVARRNILLAAPARDDLPDYSSGVTFRPYLDPTHLRHYTRESLEALLKSCGQEDFTVEKFHRVRPALFYRRAGIPRFLLGLLDAMLWLAGTRSDSFMRDYFVEIRLKQ
jgi:SAM-dependent methyltransferase